MGILYFHYVGLIKSYVQNIILETGLENTHKVQARVHKNLRRATTIAEFTAALIHAAFSKATAAEAHGYRSIFCAIHCTKLMETGGLFVSHKGEIIKN